MKKGYQVFSAKGASYTSLGRQAQECRASKNGGPKVRSI